MFLVIVEAAIYQDGRWLIIKRSEKEKHAAGLLALVGGKVDLEDHPNDILEHAMRREIKEEIAIEVNDLRYVKSASFLLPDGRCALETIFFCRPKSGIPHAVSADEVAELYWMTTDDVLNHPSAPDYLKDQISQAAKVLHD
ncbi:NUDIX domain-containing protein [Sporolactobacillus laevolacticus]|uniref:8-oxo-dGTP diphosphatase n=1 Tax=Sporolactobacillus laevolacticus DSM 442 TaxID=1395513 RepID=V6IU54_9BACL|nr:NUDIX domain-containing protein [Sporolactobacillus laevolacticus]EST10437.1 DNA mismatch repair protein MutT [Sporolactobacillus laevolacticus DSM 442]